MSSRSALSRKQVAVVIPAYNEERTIVSVIRGLKEKGYGRIVVVDDGSSDRTGELARRQGAVVVSHFLNRGYGGALGTGIKAALHFNPQIIVTFDADGQHDPDDIARLVSALERGIADVVIGTRMMNPKGMPWSRRLANRVANMVTYLFFGTGTTDSQSGLRAFSRQAARRIRLLTSGMELSSEILAEIARNRLRYCDAPIRTIYTDYSLSKGQSFRMGLRTLRKLILAKLRRSSL